jgi:ubiquinone/menaquinone biosynthesis C-methylase UbiE
MTWEEAVCWLKSQPNKIDLVRNCYYDDPIEQSMERFYVSSEWRAIQVLLSNLTPGSVLDIGAGRGISSYAFAKEGWKVSALEPDGSAVVGAQAIEGIAKTCSLNIQVWRSSAETLPFSNDSFDFVYGRAVLHHLPDLPRVCAEVYRVLKPGGCFLFSREHVIRDERERQKFFAAHPLHQLYGGENALPLQQYLLALTTGGLRPKKILKPYDSDMNLFPASFSGITARLKRVIHFSPPLSLIKALLNIRGIVHPTPGNLYSFFGVK